MLSPHKGDNKFTVAFVFPSSRTRRKCSGRHRDCGSSPAARSARRCECRKPAKAMASHAPASSRQRCTRMPCSRSGPHHGADRGRDQRQKAVPHADNRSITHLGPVHRTARFDGKTRGFFAESQFLPRCQAPREARFFSSCEGGVHRGIQSETGQLLDSEPQSLPATPDHHQQPHNRACLLRSSRGIPKGPCRLTHGAEQCSPEVPR